MPEDLEEPEVPQDPEAVAEQEEQAAALSYGEPFDSGFALAERHQLTPDLPAALAVYGELLAVAESFEDSPDVRLLRGHLLSDIGTVQLAATDLPGAALSIGRSLDLVGASRPCRWDRTAAGCGWRSC